MADLSCYIATFNCGRALVDTDFFAANFFNGLKTGIPPDLVVLTLQEIAPIGYSFLGGSLLTPYFTRFATAVHNATSQRFGVESDYGAVAVRNVGMTAIMVFARPRLEEKIRSIGTAGVGVGHWEMGNKGAVGVRLGLEVEGEEAETAVTFVAAHLAPMEEMWERRNQDWRNICEGLVFEKARTIGGRMAAKDLMSGSAEAEPLLSSTSTSAGPEGRESQQHTLFSPASYIFFAGDLNYRISDTPPQPNDFHNWPQPIETTSDPRHYSHFLAKDQLTRERRKNATLHQLAEADISFPPTYKYASAAQKQAAHAVGSRDEEEQVWLWAKHRVPSWCDRILYLESASPKINSYTALPIQPTSDHRPVVLSFSLSLKPSNQLSAKPPFQIRQDWRAARAAARRSEIMVGLASYLALTWEGEALLAGTVVGVLGGYLVLRAMIGT